uniref:Tryptophan synthase beta chain-like PALP domain-containing protein n=1 Tax=OCS116 cluster bacterium TaxID=2030921 RepID=A0A2A4Z511_9PROT
MFTLDCLHKAQAEIYAHMPATAQYSWPLLNERAGKELWIKHENHTPTGAFKVRGGLLYMARLKASGFSGGLVTATRGNHGQSIGLAGKKMGIPVTIVVPEGNSLEKNAAMKALGAELIIHGKDFDEARAHAAHLSKTRNLQSVPSFHPDLVVGVATYAYEFFKNAPDLDKVYVPIGMGSGICGMIRTRDLMGLKTKVIAVISENAPAYALSLEKGEIVQTETANTFADGVACRQPDPMAFEMVKQGADHIVQVSDEEIKAAIRAYYTDTHNVAEGAGAVGLAGLLQEVRNGACDADERLGTVLSGGNIDMDMFKDII